MTSSYYQILASVAVVATVTFAIFFLTAGTATSGISLLSLRGNSVVQEDQESRQLRLATALDIDPKTVAFKSAQSPDFSSLPILGLSDAAASEEQQLTTSTFHSSSSSKQHDPRYISAILCKLVDNLPPGWCMDDNQIPRYLGQDVTNNAPIGGTFEVLHYTHDGYQKCLAGKNIVFIGESRVRYQYNHLLLYLKNKRFMKCQDHQSYAKPSSTAMLPEPECLLINQRMTRAMAGQTGNFNTYQWWYKETAQLLTGSDQSGEETQDSLCDCYRPMGEYPADHAHENRYTKRNTRYGQTNMIFLDNHKDKISMNEDFPPYTPFYTTSNKRCIPGECGRAAEHEGDSVDAWSSGDGGLNDILSILPSLNATHAFVNPGWEFARDPSCELNEFARKHRDIKVAYISNPPDLRPDRPIPADPTKMKCRVAFLDRTTMSTGVPESWYWNDLHVWSILNEEYNHQLIKMICPIG